MTIFDCFTYNGEDSCLRIRGEELKPLGVKHILVESNYTFTGKKQRCHFAPNRKDFAGYDIMQIFHTHSFAAEKNLHKDPWTNETNQRNSIMEGLRLSGAKPEDIVIISDVDEIPRRSAIESYRPEMGITALVMDTYWYKFNCLTEKQTWKHPKILTYLDLVKSSPQEVRSGGYKSEIKDAGFHFSYLGDAEFIKRKLESFSHSEYNTPEINNYENIEAKIERGEALWADSKFEFVQLDQTFPEYILSHQEEFKHLIKHL